MNTRRALLGWLGFTGWRRARSGRSAEPSGYRMEAYRAPTPAGLHGAKDLTTEEAHTVWAKEQAETVDVLPRPPRPQGLPASTMWRPKTRFNTG